MTKNMNGKRVFDEKNTSRKVKTIHLKRCGHCGRIPELKSRELDRHLFWRVVCTGCGIGTWCTEDGYGHMGNAGRALAAAEWNSRA